MPTYKPLKAGPTVGQLPQPPLLDGPGASSVQQGRPTNWNLVAAK